LTWTLCAGTPADAQSGAIKMLDGKEKKSALTVGNVAVTDGVDAKSSPCRPPVAPSVDRRIFTGY
jgi:hypothetical protein